MLPKILEALDDQAWRTKQAAISLLGAMAYCAPKQLGQCLPLIVPKLTAAFSDTHPKVLRSAVEGAKILFFGMVQLLYEVYFEH